MKSIKQCPQCQARYEMSEEFCSQDMVKLVIKQDEQKNETQSEFHGKKSSLSANDVWDDMYQELDIRSDGSANHEFPIPDSLLVKGYRFVNRIMTDHRYNDVLIDDGEGEKILRVYHSDILSNETSLKGLIDDPRFILNAIGRDCFGNMNPSQSWELLSKYSEYDSHQDNRVQHKQGNANAALDYAKKLLALIIDVEQYSTLITLEPEHIVQANQQLQLVFFGSLHEKLSDQSMCYVSALENSNIMSNIYRAPEVLEGYLYPNSIIFSLGQIVAESYFGSSLSHQQISRGDIQWISIHNDKLQTLLRGCLYPDATKRWTLNDLVSFLAGDVQPTSASWAALSHNAAEEAMIIGSYECWTPRELADAISEETWDESAANINRILSWMSGTHCAAKAAYWQSLIRDHQVSDDYILVSIKRNLSTNQSKMWRKWSLEDADVEHTLIHLAQQTLAGNHQALSDLHNSKLTKGKLSALDVI